MLYEKLSSYAGTKDYPFHMPGHKRNMGLFPENEWLPYQMDITEIDGFDNLHDPQELLLESTERAADIYGTAGTFYLVNGSSCGNLAAICAATRRKDEILMARNCHQSVYHAVVQNGLCPHYIYPEYYKEKRLGILKGISSSQVKEALKQYPKANLLVITSPTYEGFLSELEEIVKAAHAHDIPVLVDEAHGAHLPFCERREDGVVSAITAGADLVVQSVHKTLPSLTQTALLHVTHEGMKRVDMERIRYFLGVYQSSSPSYPLMAAIERSISFAAGNAWLFREHDRRLTDFYQEAGKLKVLKVLMPKGEPFDRHKLVILTENVWLDNQPLTGKRLSDILHGRYHLVMEMASMHYVIAMTSICDTKEGLRRLSEALMEIDKCCVRKAVPEKERPYMEQTDREQTRGTGTCQEEDSLPWEAMEQEGEWVALSDALGKKSSRNVLIYPPGIPILVMGETVTKECLEEITSAWKAGLPVKGVRLLNEEGVLLCVIKP